jgi:hypothetical protein
MTNYLSIPLLAIVLTAFLEYCFARFFYYLGITGNGDGGVA